MSLSLLRASSTPFLCLCPQSNPRSGSRATSAKLTSAKWGNTSTWSSPSRCSELGVGGLGSGLRALAGPSLTSRPRPQGKPRPQVVWTKGGAPVDPARVHVRTSDFDTVFFVRQAARSDSGEYELTVQIENMKDTATIHIQVVGAWPVGAGGRHCGPGSGERVEEGDRWGWGGKVRKWEWGEIRIWRAGEGAEVGRGGERRGEKVRGWRLTTIPSPPPTFQKRPGQPRT